MTSTAAWQPAYIGIGSNLDDPESRVRRAFDQLRAVPQSAAFVHSSLYRSAPTGPGEQPDFVNAVAAFLTRMNGIELLRALQTIESVQDRQRGERWGPRTLDLDLLVLGRTVTDTAVLAIPHPRIGERNFVLLPLAEIAPYLSVPGRGSVVRMVAAVAGKGPRIERLA